ncbi:LacI family DNA-binding transcriptional regulator [Lysinibacter sp. HNR]|uniref:LacI family DNA-binding transcriptional regulator n=1 Tax=Lysinibacter sp. HNR TaxID=3031408 RepID=UPI0024350176|nr:LacI family DNA-binding transcriptional regulator [Lysinibacter sp. HNR]WGD37395.1 LacI family DNA-binding transcriptional regulator [Lysinibacter sp. HNR]
MAAGSQGARVKSEPKRVTLAHVAHRAGVSTSTVSLAFGRGGPISSAMRERVIAAAAELGYAGPDPRAASLRRGRSGLIGVVLGERLGGAFRDPIRVALLDGISEAVGNAGSGLALLGDTDGGPLNISTAPVDAVIFFGCSTGLDSPLADIRRRGLPMVEMEGMSADDVYVIDSDNRGASRTGAEHLRSLGHERVAIVSLPLDQECSSFVFDAAYPLLGHSFVAEERILGVRDVYPEAGGSTSRASLVEEGRLAGKVLLGGAADSERPLDQEVRPTGVVAQSDLLALGVIRAAEELGLRVPQDVSVVGFDGILLDGLSEVELSTLVQPAQAKGRAAGEAALALIEGESVPPQSFHAVLRVGATTGPVPSS